MKKLLNLPNNYSEPVKFYTEYCSIYQILHKNTTTGLEILERTAWKQLSTKFRSELEKISAETISPTAKEIFDNYLIIKSKLEHN